MSQSLCGELGLDVGRKKSWKLNTAFIISSAPCDEYSKECIEDRLIDNQRDYRITRKYFEFMEPQPVGTRFCSAKSSVLYLF